MRKINVPSLVAVLLCIIATFYVATGQHLEEALVIAVVSLTMAVLSFRE